MPQKLFIYGEALERGGYPDECPFDTRRAGRARAAAASMGLLDGADRAETAPVPLSRRELERFHAGAYLDALSSAEAGGLSPAAAARFGLGTPDCPVFRGMFDYVRLAAGGTTTAARAIAAGDVTIAFNPSGGFHHAMPGNAAGFCYLNDVVLGIMELVDAGKRVLFLDIDVHHCDGVQDAFYDRRDVMTLSLHESGRTLFPGTGFENETGIGVGCGYAANFPLPVGTYDAAYEKVFREGALPLVQAFDPDVIVLELGMDTLAGDPLAHLHLTNNVPADIVKTMAALGKPLLATGGGGYHVENTVRGWALCWSVLCGEHEAQHDLMAGMGGVMLENTDWLGGLRDRVLLADGGRRDAVDAEVSRVLDRVRRAVFPAHGL